MKADLQEKFDDQSVACHLDPSIVHKGNKDWCSRFVAKKD